MKKRIIFSNYDDVSNPHIGGGGAHAIFEIAKRLSGFYDIEIITAAFPGSRNNAIDGIQFNRIGYAGHGPKIGQLMFQALLPYYVRTKHYDLWVENLTPPCSGSLLPVLSKKPLVGLVHMLSGKDMKRKYHLPFDIAEKYLLKLYRHIIVTTDNSQQFIQSVNSRAQIALIPNGIEIPYCTGKTNSADQYVLFLGRIEMNQKGLDMLLDAFKQIHTHGVQLIIAGGGTPSEVSAMSSHVKKLRLENRIRIIGRVQETEKKKLISNASAIAVPSRFETFSLTALEAMASRKPLITFDIEGLSWIPHDCRFVANSLDAQSLAQTIHNAITDAHSRAMTIRNAYHFAKQYSWRNVTEKYFRFFDTLVS